MPYLFPFNKLTYLDKKFNQIRMTTLIKAKLSKSGGHTKTIHKYGVTMQLLTNTIKKSLYILCIIYIQYILNCDLNIGIIRLIVTEMFC